MSYQLGKNVQQLKWYLNCLLERTKYLHENEKQVKNIWKIKRALNLIHVTKPTLDDSINKVLNYCILAVIDGHNIFKKLKNKDFKPYPYEFSGKESVDKFFAGRCCMIMDMVMTNYSYADNNLKTKKNIKREVLAVFKSVREINLLIGYAETITFAIKSLLLNALVDTVMTTTMLTESWKLELKS